MSDNRDPFKPQILGVADQYPVTVTFSEVYHVYGVALQRARACGLSPENAEDTAQEFGSSWLSALKEDRPWAKQCLASEPYLKSCTVNFTYDATGRLQNQYNREWQWPLPANDEAAAHFENLPCQQPGPEKQALRKELRQVLSETIDRLQYRPRFIFTRCVIHRQTMMSIAEELGLTPNAVSHSFCASRERLKAHLAAAGYTETEIREYMYELSCPD